MRVRDLSRVVVLYSTLGFLLSWNSSPCVANGAFSANGTERAEGLQAGAATSNITPPLGGGIVGGFAPIPSQHVHDELHARCLVLDDGKTRLALVVCDVLGMHRAVSDEARRLIQERIGIPKENVLISATHTHSACSALGGDRYQFHIELDAYQTFLAGRIADGVQRAANQLRPAEAAFGSVDIPEHVFNRRWFMADGKVPPNPFGETDRVKMNPPAGSPDLVQPAGPVDPTVSFLAVRGTDGQLISLYSAYSLHYVGGVGPGHISADYYGMFCQQVEKLCRSDDQDVPFVAMMANGTSGDINNINFVNPRAAREPYAQIRYVACDVAEKVHGAMAGLAWKANVTLAACYQETDVRWRRPTEKQIAWATQKLAEPPQKSGRTDLPRIYAERTLSLANQPEKASIPVQVLRIGDVCIGTLPCEVFVQIGLDFRKHSEQRPAFLVSLGHGYFGYLPTQEQHALGGYETWLGTSRMEVGTADILLATLIEMSRAVRLTVP